MRFDHEKFFNGCREIWGRLKQPQVEGLEFLLSKIEDDDFTLPQAAYVLATVKHETANTFQPIKEYRARKGTRLRGVQDRYWLSGFYGRGYVMITWEANYQKFGIADNPDKALEPETAYQILSRGMKEGLFTKHKLSHYINGEVDYVQARRIVNGLDKANEIALIAEKFESALRTSLVTDPVTDQPKPETAKPEDVAGPQINVEHADEVKADTPAQPIEGGAKDDPPKQASQGGNKSTIATIAGGITGAGAAVGGWFHNNGSLAMVGIICATVVILTWMFRQLIMDYLRVKILSDPSKINAK